MNLHSIASRIQRVVKNEGVQSAIILFFVILVLGASAISVLGYVLHFLDHIEQLLLEAGSHKESGQESLKETSGIG
jgi:hypothetical protein